MLWILDYILLTVLHIQFRHYTCQPKILSGCKCVFNTIKLIVFQSVVINYTLTTAKCHTSSFVLN